jgi:uncharacterized protein GlcG (DUF336 family)
MLSLVKKHSISFELSQKIVAPAVANAREIGVCENVVNLDDSGNLKAFGRMDRAPIPGSRCEEFVGHTFKETFDD